MGVLVSAPSAARRLTVDGEVFEVRPSEHQDGVDFDWITGPNPGYGFSSGVTAVAIRTAELVSGLPAIEDAIPVLDDKELVAQIRSFLELIDPETGYVAD